MNTTGNGKKVWPETQSPADNARMLRSTEIWIALMHSSLSSLITLCILDIARSVVT